MTEFFVSVVNMSISAGWIVLAVLLLRLLLKKAPKWITVLLWGIVAVRLICPFSIESALSLIPSAQTINPEVALNPPTIDSGVPIVDNIVNPVIGGATISFQPEKELNFFKFIMPYLAGLWLVGIAVLLVYTVVSYVRVRRKIGTAVLLRENIFQSESVVSPFVLGIIKPKIYLPFNMNEQDMEHVIAHEQAHIRRKDHWWKPFGFLLLTIHWFNPLMWLGYVLLCRDIELACDEKVIKELNTEQKADYSQALLTCSVNRRIIAACPLAFGEVGVKNRVKSVLNYKKPAFWIVVIAIVASIVVAVCFLTNPKQDTDLGISSQKSGSDLKGITLEIIDTDLSAPDPFIKVKWTNDTDKKITYGEEFYIYQNINDAWEDCRNDSNYFWTLPGYLAMPNSTSEKDYHLNGLIMTQTGKYRFETEFSVDGVSDQKYKAWIEFELTTGVDGITVHTFEPVAIVYDDGRYSYVQTLENAPTFRIVNAMQLQKIDSNGNVETICILEPITLNNDNFDTRFMGGSESWLEDETLKTLKENNKRAWQQTVSDGDNHLLYLLLEQNDGTFYLGYGYYGIAGEATHNPDDSHIRWLYRLSSVSIADVGGADKPTNIIVGTTLEQLKLKYPQFFNVSTDGGLKVYIWQMSKDNYQCYLINRSIDIFADQSFAFEVGTTIAEMRAILTTYDIEQKDIIIHPVRNPLSSYYYEIDDAYQAKVEELFWNTIAPVDAPKTASDLNNAIAKVLSEKYRAEKPDGLLHIENYHLLANETASGTPIKGNSGHMEEATVYLLVYHMKYSVNGGQLEEVEGDFVPTSISFKIDENGQYTLKEYWTPRSGANYEKDVLGKFPGESATDVLNTELYAEDLIKENWRLAKEYMHKINGTSSTLD